MRRLIAIGAVTAVFIGLMASPAAALLVRANREVSFTVAVTGTPDPYQLHVVADDVGSGANDDMDIQLTRTATTGHKPQQTHDFFVRGITVSCTSGLGTCSIDSGSQMGSFGHINLTFTASSQTTTTQQGCPNFWNSTYTVARRSGSATGQFRLVTGTTYFHTIRNTASAQVHIPASIPAKASKLTYGSTCPATPPGPCVAYLTMSLHTAANGAISANQYSAGKGSVDFVFTDNSVPSVTATHTIFGQGTVTVVAVQSNTPKSLQKMTVSIPFSPFITGNGTFVGGADPTTSTPGNCTETDRSGSYTGTFTAHLDGWGTKSFNGTRSADASRVLPTN